MNKLTTVGTATRHVALGVVAAMGFCLAAHAAHADEAAPQRSVGYSDLDTGTSAGAAALYRRIKNAAAEVCGPSVTLDLTMVAAAKACQDKAIRTAVIAVNKPLVTRAYLAATHQAPGKLEVASLP
jgi:UrcA family protein